MRQERKEVEDRIESGRSLVLTGGLRLDTVGSKRCKALQGR